MYKRQGKGYLGISYHLKGLLDFHVEIDIPGKFSIYNSLTAIAICRHFKVSEENIPVSYTHLMMYIPRVRQSVILVIRVMPIQTVRL